VSRIEADMEHVGRTRRRAALEHLVAMEAYVRVTNPAYPDSGWHGRIVGLLDSPSILLACDDGRRAAVPQAFIVEECLARPKPDMAMVTADELEALRSCQGRIGEAVKLIRSMSDDVLRGSARWQLLAALGAEVTPDVVRQL
jgi:hypothetical protein